MERVLQHKIDDLVGAKLTELIVPSSRARLTQLVKNLVDMNNHRTAVAEWDSLEIDVIDGSLAKNLGQEFEKAN